MVDVDVVRAQTAQAAFERLAQMGARRTLIVWPGAGRKSGFGGDEHLVALAFERLPEDLFRSPLRIAVGGVEQVDARVEAEIHQSASFVDFSCAHCLEEARSSAEGGGSIGQR